uniref:Uncharacterized protein n=1 Tax=Arundo donax TaxID=35708 RepID=A0A0A9HAV1_ARUDO
MEEDIYTNSSSIFKYFWVLADSERIQQC